MKISNETKVGALAAVAITLLILGFNFLKGKSIFKTGNYIYAKYQDAKGLMVSNPVYINGLQVGAIDDLEEANRNLSSIIVSVKLNKDLNIPNNSIANISTSPLGGSSMEITLGDSKQYLKSGDTILTSGETSLLGDITKKVGPVVDQVKVTLKTLDSVLRNMNSIFDPNTKNNFQSIMANLNRTTATLAISSAQLNDLLGGQSGTIERSLENVNAFTRNLASNNERINGVLANMETTTSNLSKSDIQGTVEQLQTTIARLNTAVEKMDSKEGSLGLLLNDKQLYNNLANTSRSLNILMDDVRVNPKRYLTIGVSLFGGKSKAQPLMSPLPVTDTNTIVTQGTQ